MFITALGQKLNLGRVNMKGSALIYQQKRLKGLILYLSVWAMMRIYAALCLENRVF